MTASPQHVVLLGDSIFDNARYVPRRPAVIKQMRDCLPAGSKATLLAVDGAVTEDVARQLKQLPEDATHLVISVGGNDALGASQILYDVTSTAAEGMNRIAGAQRHFRRYYREMLTGAVATRLNVVACTVYDSCPNLRVSDIAGLSVFNDVILTECFQRAVPVIDLRLICDADQDYSELSPIEPSEIGGGKIARAVKRMLLTHDFTMQQTVVYGAA